MLATEAGSIEPGGQGETVALVRNTGEAGGDFRVTVRGPAAAWASVEPSTLTLAPGEEAPAWVCFRPPRSADTRPGDIPYTVVVESPAGIGADSREEGVVRVGTFSSLAASFIGEPTVGARWTQLAVAVRNTGNRKVRVGVEAEAGDPGVSFDIEPGELDLGPGEVADFEVRARPPRRLLPGRASHRQVAVAVVSDGGALATLRAELPDEPSLSHELFRSARLLAILLILSVVAALSILRSSGGSSDGTEGSEPSVSLPLPGAPDQRGDPDQGVPGPVAPEEPPPAATDADPEARPAPVPPLPKVVFVRVYDAGSQDIVVRQPGSRTSELRLRSDGSLESRPRLSPGGSHVAFVRERELTWKICVIPAAAGDTVCVADGSTTSDVAWGPGGDRLYFTRGARLYEIPYDPASRVAGEERDLGVEVPPGHFSLSPAGDRIVFAQGGGLTVRPVDGSPGVQVNVPGQPESPAWSPDGSRIVYVADFQIYTAPAGGGPVRRLTASGTVNADPAWCAEGDWVIFRSNRSGVADLYVVKGSAREAEVGLARVTSSPEREMSPAF